MQTHADKSQESTSQQSTTPVRSGQQRDYSGSLFEDNRPEAIQMRKQKQAANRANKDTPRFEDNRPEATIQRQMIDVIKHSPQSQRMAQLQSLADNQSARQKPLVQKQSVNTAKSGNGLPENLKAGVESLSGYAMDDVKVHYNSAKPAQLSAHAYAEGTNIHLASGQEKHLPHEAWHVVQQKQGRVRPTTQLKGGININDDVKLEKEADVMGARALRQVDVTSSQNEVAQLQPVLQFTLEEIMLELTGILQEDNKYTERLRSVLNYVRNPDGGNLTRDDQLTSLLYQIRNEYQKSGGSDTSKLAELESGIYHARRDASVQVSLSEQMEGKEGDGIIDADNYLIDAGNNRTIVETKATMHALDNKLSSGKQHRKYVNWVNENTVQEGGERFFRYYVAKSEGRFHRLFAYPDLWKEMNQLNGNNYMIITIDGVDLNYARIKELEQQTGKYVKETVDELKALGKNVKFIDIYDKEIGTYQDAVAAVGRGWTLAGTY